jgi:hypothetical protein
MIRLRHKILNRSLSSLWYFSTAVAVLFVAISRGRAFGEYSRLGAILLIPAVTLCAAGIFISSTSEPRPMHQRDQVLLRLLFCTAVLYQLIATMRIIQNLPGGIIDVYLFQQRSAAALLHKVDPYTLTTPNIYGLNRHFYGSGVVVNGRVQIGFPYPPASLFFVLPFYLMGDIRFAYITAILLSAGLVMAFRTDLVTTSVASLLLLSPVTLFVESQSWTEPFVLLALTFTIYASVKERWWLPIALGIFFASKQYSVLAIPFLPLLLGEHRWKPVVWRLLAKSLGVSAALTVPMAVWNWHGFCRDVILFQLRQPFRPDALTLGNLFFPFPQYLILAFVVFGTFFSLSKARPHPSMFAACFGFTFLIFVCTNKQAFCNYYFLVIQTFLLAISTLAIPMKSESVPTELQELVLPVVEYIGCRRS